MNIKKNDTVIVLSGKDKGKKGKVLVAMPSENKVVVEGVNVATCHTKPRKQGEEGGIVRREIPIRADKVQLVCPKCGKATRVAHNVIELTISGKKTNKSVRACKKCNAVNI
jgi:large subunit ribosomal protein L24